jgi:hypothetical protein
MSDFTDEDVQRGADACRDLWAAGLYSGPPTHEQISRAVLSAVLSARETRAQPVLSDAIAAHDKRVRAEAIQQLRDDWGSVGEDSDDYEYYQIGLMLLGSARADAEDYGHHATDCAVAAYWHLVGHPATEEPACTCRADAEEGK